MPPGNDPAPLFENWFHCMRESRRGSRALTNLAHDLEHARLPKSVILALLQELIQQWSQVLLEERSSRMAEEVLRVTTRSESYLCRGYVVEADVDQYSRIMDVNDLINNNLLDLTKLPIPISENLTPEQILDLEPDGIEGATQGEMRTGRAFAWVTKTQNIEELRQREDPTQLAESIRDEFGLVHQRAGVHLVEIVYPPSILQDNLFAPTFIEGYPCCAYRSVATADRWGRTVHLQTCEQIHPEAVHRSVSFAQSGFRLRNIGRVLTSDDDDDHCDRCYPKQS